MKLLKGKKQTLSLHFTIQQEHEPHNLPPTDFDDDASK